MDRRFRRNLQGHVISTTRELRCEALANGELLGRAADEKFDVFLTVDKQIEHQQNLSALPLPVILIDCISNVLPVLIPFAAAILKLLEQPLQNVLYVIAADGTVAEVMQPRAKP